MYGARRATSRSVGTLNACRSFTDVGNNRPRPMSPSAAVPMSWNEKSVNDGPSWQLAQPALSLNSTKPRFAAALIAVSSPSIQRSNGAGDARIVRSNVAIACSM